MQGTRTTHRTARPQTWRGHHVLRKKLPTRTSQVSRRRLPAAAPQVTRMAMPLYQPGNSKHCRDDAAVSTLATGNPTSLTDSSGQAQTHSSGGVYPWEPPTDHSASTAGQPNGDSKHVSLPDFAVTHHPHPNVVWQ